MKKNSAPLLLSVLALLAVSSLQAQTVTSVVVGKSTEFVQTGASTVIVDPTAPSATYGGPWGFTATVKGTGLSAPTVDLPNTSGMESNPANSSAHNGGVLGDRDHPGEWQYGASNFNNWGSPTMALRNSLFANGLYTFTIPDVGSVALNLTVPTTPITGAPVFDVTGGTWTGGVYQVSTAQTLTISSQAFAQFNANVNGRILFGMWDAEGEDEPIVFVERLFSDVADYEDGVDNVVSFTVDPGQLSAGHSYVFGAAFSAIVDTDESASFMTAAFFELSTTFTISAVPEPSTYAMLAGIAALGLALWRRRQAAA